MVTQEDNGTLTQVGKGTAMGEFLRRYWHPIAALSEFESPGAKPVRLLGEDLVLYRDRSGTYGLIDRHCQHRRADLSYGFVEECGLRCSYHGWAYDHLGNCIAQPYEDLANQTSHFRDAIKITAYPVEPKAGLLFAYLGPEPAPLCPNWELFDYEDGFRQIIFGETPCNWLQCAENDIDPVHFEWLHNNWSIVQSGRGGSYAPRHVRLAFEEWEYGFAYKRILENSDENDPTWLYPRLHLMPNIFMAAGSHFEYRVPVDDHNTLNVVWAYDPVPLEQRPYRQDRIPHWCAQITDPDTGRMITTHVINQDTVAWVGQGTVVDRSLEHLGKSDLGIIKFRRQLQRDMDAVARGEDPKGVVRDPEKNRIINWPDNPSRRPQVTIGLAKQEWIEKRRKRRNGLRPPDDYFQFYAGQPEDVRKAYEEAMGI